MTSIALDISGRELPPAKVRNHRKIIKKISETLYWLKQFSGPAIQVSLFKNNCATQKIMQSSNYVF